MKANQVVFRLMVVFVISILVAFFVYHIILSSDWAGHFRAPTFNVNVALDSNSRNRLIASNENITVSVYYETTSRSFPGSAMHSNHFEISPQGGLVTIPEYDLSRFETFSFLKMITLILNREHVHDKIRAITVHVYSAKNAATYKLLECSSIHIGHPDLSKLYQTVMTFNSSCT